MKRYVDVGQLVSGLYVHGVMYIQRLDFSKVCGHENDMVVSKLGHLEVRAEKAKARYERK